jgi:hypothetical protein
MEGVTNLPGTAVTLRNRELKRNLDTFGIMSPQLHNGRRHLRWAVIIPTYFGQLLNLWKAYEKGGDSVAPK